METTTTLERIGTGILMLGIMGPAIIVAAQIHQIDQRIQQRQDCVTQVLQRKQAERKADEAEGWIFQNAPIRVSQSECPF